ncbi:hypothetical protein ACFVW8_34060 [Streptomyces sp. NPDC058221]|uniref:hypothetical protein n=1 Tax=Streptomyces sp. NPDC058221 TaxID=3346388 RepID=UPI0036E16407
MLRRIAITMATVAAAGFVAAAPAVAHNSDDGREAGKLSASHTKVEGSAQSGELLNLGGPYGITYAKGHKTNFAGEHGELYAEYLQSH